MRIYKIFRGSEWAELDRTGETEGSADDQEDGFVHFSTKDQLGATLAKHFKAETGLVLGAAEADDFGDDLRWENDFPHLYRPLKRDDIVWHQEIPRGGTDQLKLGEE